MEIGKGLRRYQRSDSGVGTAVTEFRLTGDISLSEMAQIAYSKHELTCVTTVDD